VLNSTKLKSGVIEVSPVLSLIPFLTRISLADADCNSIYGNLQRDLLESAVPLWKNKADRRLSATLINLLSFSSIFSFEEYEGGMNDEARCKMATEPARRNKRGREELVESELYETDHRFSNNGNNADDELLERELRWVARLSLLRLCDTPTTQIRMSWITQDFVAEWASAQ